LHLLSGQGVFAGAIEEALLGGAVDLAVHSLKDLPAADRPGLLLAAFPPREDARDALVCRRGGGLGALPRGARIATGSPRRAAQLRAARPDLRIVGIRGNLDTRLRKLETEHLDALVLAVAGLRRLGLAERITEPLPLTLCLPAVGQGALAVQCRADDSATRALLAPLDDLATRAAVLAERAFLSALGGGCKVPIAAHAAIVDGRLRLDGLLASSDGHHLLRDSVVGGPVTPSTPVYDLIELGGPTDTTAPTHGATPTDLNTPAALGQALASRLRAAGGADLLAARAD
jgi:hydroxymethylbilane synthase